MAERLSNGWRAGGAEACYHPAACNWAGRYCSKGHALDAGGQTVAVLAGGLNRIYHNGHRNLPGKS